jgi:hypothetical protein
MAARADAATILSSFPGPVTLYRSRKKWLLLLAISTALAFGGALMIRDGPAQGWFVLVFFAAGALISAVMLLPGASALVLDHDGFEINSLFRRSRTRWQDTSGFVADHVPRAPQRFVLYDDARISTWRSSKIAVALAGHNGMLPDTFGLSADDLAWLMAGWRQGALGETAAGGTAEQPRASGVSQKRK